MNAKVKAPFWNPNMPVNFLAANIRHSKDGVSPEDAIEERASFALRGIPVTTWQNGKRVIVPMHESRRYG